MEGEFGYEAVGFHEPHRSLAKHPRSALAPIHVVRGGRAGTHPDLERQAQGEGRRRRAATSHVLDDNQLSGRRPSADASQSPDNDPRAGPVPARVHRTELRP